MKIYNPATCSCSPFRLCCPKVKNWVEREVDAAWGPTPHVQTEACHLTLRTMLVGSHLLSVDKNLPPHPHSLILEDA